MSAPSATALFESGLRHLPLLGRGKVRDIYEVDAEHLLIVASDRLSAFDVVLPQPIPGKGEVLTRVSTSPLPGIGCGSTTSKADSRSLATISRCSASTS